jgi:hypothetical protein
LPAKNRLRFCKDEESAARLEEFLQASTPVDAKSANPDFLDALNTVQNIDAGESVLLAVGATERDTLVITGDKRAIAALCSDDSVTQVVNALERRVLSIEVLFSHLIERKFAYVQDCVRSKPKVDKSLSIAFGVTISADLNSVREGLNSYIKHLRELTGALLYPTPF